MYFSEATVSTIEARIRSLARSIEPGLSGGAIAAQNKNQPELFDLAIADIRARLDAIVALWADALEQSRQRDAGATAA